MVLPVHPRQSSHLSHPPDSLSVCSTCPTDDFMHTADSCLVLPSLSHSWFQVSCSHLASTPLLVRQLTSNILQTAGHHYPPCSQLISCILQTHGRYPSPCSTADFSLPANNWTVLPSLHIADFTHPADIWPVLPSLSHRCFCATWRQLDPTPLLIPQLTSGILQKTAWFLKTFSLHFSLESTDWLSFVFQTGLGSECWSCDSLIHPSRFIHSPC